MALTSSAKYTRRPQRGQLSGSSLSITGAWKTFEFGLIESCCRLAVTSRDARGAWLLTRVCVALMTSLLDVTELVGLLERLYMSLELLSVDRPEAPPANQIFCYVICHGCRHKARNGPAFPGVAVQTFLYRYSNRIH